MNADEQYRRIEQALMTVGMDIEPDVRTRQLYAAGVRVLQLDEVILSRSDAALLDLVQRATERWEEQKRAAGVSADSSDDTPDVKTASIQALIIAAFMDAGRPLSQHDAVWAAAHWHADYVPPAVLLDPWRDAFRKLVIQRGVRKVPGDPGTEILWELISPNGGPWIRVDELTGAVTPRDRLISVLRNSEEPLTFTEMLRRLIGRPHGGRAAPEWRRALRDLAHEGVIERAEDYWPWRLAEGDRS